MFVFWVFPRQRRQPKFFDAFLHKSFSFESLLMSKKKWLSDWQRITHICKFSRCCVFTVKNSSVNMHHPHFTVNMQHLLTDLLTDYTD